MTDQHPITPPPELVKEWRDLPEYLTTKLQGIATQAARSGADQELEACCQWVKGHWLADELRAFRRPKPPSLKAQALETFRSMQIEPVVINGVNVNADVMDKYNIIRRALASLPD